MIKRQFFKTIFLGLAVCATCPTLAQNHTPIYEVGMPANVVPYIMLDEHGKAVGFIADVLKNVGERQGMQFHFTPMPWSAMYSSLNSGNIDLVSVAVSSPERRKIYEESLPYHSAKRAVVVKDEALKDLSIDDLMSDDNIRFATIGGNSDFVKLSTRVGEERVLPVETPFLELKSLITGKVEAIYEDSEVMGYYQRKRKGIFIIEDNSIPPINNVFYAKKGNVALINKINAGLEQIAADGTLRSLEQTWFGK